MPPAPFKFVVLNSIYKRQGKDFILRIKTEGKVVPENAMILLMTKVILWNRLKGRVSI
jgi:hypothetical protein